MLKHWCENLLPRYKWFVRADDDTYLRTHMLERFLMGLDHEKVVSGPTTASELFSCICHVSDV